MNDADVAYRNEGCTPKPKRNQNKITDRASEPRTQPLHSWPERMRLGVEAVAAFSMLTKLTQAQRQTGNRTDETIYRQLEPMEHWTSLVVAMCLTWRHTTYEI